MADALIIASVGGSYLFEKAQKEYMRRAPRPYMKIVSAIMSHDLTGGFHTIPLTHCVSRLQAPLLYYAAMQLCGVLPLFLTRAGPGGRNRSDFCRPAGGA